MSHRRLAQEHLAARRFDAALDAARAAIAERSDDAEALNVMGTALAQLGRVEEAAEAYRACAVADPALHKPHANLAKILLRLGRTAEALAAARRSVELAPELPRLVLPLVQLLQSGGRDDEAVPLLGRLIESEDKPELRVALARSLERVGDLAGARAALSISPAEDPTVLTILGSIEAAEPTTRATGLARLAEVATRSPLSSLVLERRARASLDVAGPESDLARDACADLAAVHAFAAHCRPAPRDPRTKPSVVGWVFFDDDPQRALALRPQLATLAARGLEIEVLAEGAPLRALRDAGVAVVELPGGSNREVANWIAARGLAVLVDPTGPTRAGRMRVYAHAPAPVQLSLAAPVAVSGWPTLSRLAIADDDVDGLCEALKAALGRTLAGPRGARRLPLLPDLTMVLPEPLTIMSTFVIAEQGRWFEDEVDFVLALVEPGDVVADIGANMGSYALPMARRTGPSGKVIAFEPAADTAAHLAASASLNGLTWLQVEQRALGEERGSANLVHGGSPELNEIGEGEGETIEIARLDDYAGTLQDVRFIKLDAEGFEQAILRGGREVLAREPVVMFELKHRDRVNTDLIDAFAALGFGAYALCPALGALRPFDPRAIEPYQLNLFAVSPRKAVALAARGLLVEKPATDAVEPDLVRGAALFSRFACARAREAVRATDLVALMAEVRDASVSMERRASALDAAVHRVRSVPPASPFDRLTHARVLRAAGLRTMALRAIEPLVASGAPVGEPTAAFLPVIPRYEGIAPIDLDAWVGAQAVEATVQWSAFSSYFQPQSELLQSFRRFGVPSPEMGRRLGLATQLVGGGID
jgi:FkbM family methyltransferase